MVRHLPDTFFYDVQMWSAPIIECERNMCSLSHFSVFPVWCQIVCGQVYCVFNTLYNKCSLIVIYCIQSFSRNYVDKEKDT